MMENIMIRAKTLLWIPIGAMALAAGVVLSHWLRPAPTPPLEIAGIYFPAPERRSVQDFALTGQDGEPFTPENLRGTWTFMYFGYTFCPDVCPMTLSRLSQVRQRLTQRGITDTAFVLISVDPDRDTPERLREYTAFFDPTFRGATGSSSELDKITQQFGVYYKVPERKKDEYYTVDHSSTVVVTDPDGRLHAIFTHPDEPDTVVEDFVNVHQRYQDEA
jgi:protein SCO1/2